MTTRTRILTFVAIVALMLASLAPVMAASKRRTFGAAWGTAWGDTTEEADRLAPNQAALGIQSTTQANPKAMRTAIDSKWGEGPVTVNYTAACWGGAADAQNNITIEEVVLTPARLRVPGWVLESATECSLLVQIARMGDIPGDRIQIATEGHLKVELQVEY